MPPKLFISYSWTSPPFEARVLQIATELRESGVDVILDKWDLKEGHDAHAFMEQMVTDPAVKKVLLLCDKVYAEKTNERKGGVGKEAQIITGEIYENQAQDKFVAAVMERDEEGRPYLPAYYRSRIYIDLSDPSTYSDNFDQLLRWVFDKPLYKKPELGKPPEFLTSKDASVSLATSSRFRRALDAVRGSKPHAVAAVGEYFEAFAEQLEVLRLPPQADPFDDAVMMSIESFLPYRNEAIELFLAIARYLETLETREQMHRFFERLIPYLDRPAGVTSWGDWDFDNFRIIVHELFLYAVACLVRYERFEAAAYLLSTEFYVAQEADSGRAEMVNFSVFRTPVKSLGHRNHRLQLRRLSLHADILKQRCTGVAVPFLQLMQADFIIFLHANLHQGERWWPVTLVFASYHFHGGSFEIFARSKSGAYFNKVRLLLGIHSKDELGQLLSKFESGEARVPQWETDTIDPRGLLAFDEIGTKP